VLSLVGDGADDEGAPFLLLLDGELVALLLLICKINTSKERNDLQIN
jgi:hypothetical protein